MICLLWVFLSIQQQRDSILVNVMDVDAERLRSVTAALIPNSFFFRMSDVKCTNSAQNKWRWVKSSRSLTGFQETRVFFRHSGTVRASLLSDRPLLIKKCRRFHTSVMRTGLLGRCYSWNASMSQVQHIQIFLRMFRSHWSSSRKVRPVASSCFCNLRLLDMAGGLIPRETRQVKSNQLCRHGNFKLSAI